MAINRASNPELYDSFYEGKPSAPPSSARRPPPPLPHAASRVMRTATPVPASIRDEEAVAIAMTSSAAPVVRETLHRAGLVVGGRESARSARVIVIDSDHEGAAGAVVAARRESSPDTAIVVVLSGSYGSKSAVEAIRAASRAGAFACLHVPIVAEELQSIVTAAVDVGAAKAKIANLSKKLDLNAHLTSIGRISAGLTHEIANPLGIAATNIEAIAGETERLFELLDNIVQAPYAQLPNHLREAESEIAHARGPDGVMTALHDSKVALRRINALLGTMRDLVAGVGNTQRSSIDLLAVANEVATRWLAREHGGVQVSVVGTSVEVPADPVLVQQILQNLTANAIHAVQAQADAQVRLHVYQAEDHAIISIRDNGPGIAPENQERVFEPFFTTRRGIGGTGLGLALCREYALRMDADLSLWSVVGRGTCFRLSIPLPV